MFSELQNSEDWEQKQDLNDLIIMHEYMVPSYSLDILALLVVAVGKGESKSECCKALQDIEKVLFAKSKRNQD